MAYELRDNSGSLFKNTRKKAEKEPDYRGDVMVGGAVKQIAGWIKKTQSGETFLSLAFSDKQEKPEAAKPKVEEPLPDDLPF